MTTTVIGACVDCGRPMLSQKVWTEQPELRVGRVRSAARGRCNNGCYASHLKQVRADKLAEEQGGHVLEVPAAVRLAVEQQIACGRRTSQIMAQLDVPYEVVAGVRERLDRLEAAS